MSAEMDRLRSENERLRRHLDEGLIHARKLREACVETGSPVVPVAVAKAMSDLSAWHHHVAWDQEVWEKAEQMITDGRRITFGRIG